MPKKIKKTEEKPIEKEEIKQIEIPKVEEVKKKRGRPKKLSN